MFKMDNQKQLLTNNTIPARKYCVVEFYTFNITVESNLIFVCGL